MMNGYKLVSALALLILVVGIPVYSLAEPDRMAQAQVALRQEFVTEAAAPIFEKQLPEITPETHNTVVVLNLRGYDELGSTFLTVLEKYLVDLRKRNSKLILAGVSLHVVAQLEKTGLIREIGRENIYPATEQLGQAGLEAWEAADKWVAEHAAGQKVADPVTAPRPTISEPDQGNP